MKIYVGSGGMLERLYQLSDKRHILVDAPEKADIIIVILPGNDQQAAKEFKLVRRFPKNCFGISVTDWPAFMVHGIYANSAGRIARWGSRIRTGSYMTTSDLCKNKAVEAEQSGAALTSEKRYLFSFIGRSSHKVRDKLFQLKIKRQDVIIENSSEYFNMWGGEHKALGYENMQHRYCDILKSSKFALCPAGVSPNSIRLFEAMKLGVAVVVIADEFRFPVGPRWEKFCLVIPESNVLEIEEILVKNEPRYLEMGEAASEAYERYFSDRSYFNWAVENCVDILRDQWLPERIARALLTGYLKISAMTRVVRKKMGIRSRLKFLLSKSG